MRATDQLPIGQIARRTGLSVSAIRFYEDKGLITPERNAGGQRRYLRSDIRRLSFILIAQQLGFSIRQIKTQLRTLPDQRTPTQRDWTRMSRDFRQVLDDKIATLERLRDRLDGCIGCGCLSLRKCALYNPGDTAGERGTGPRHVVEARLQTD